MVNMYMFVTAAIRIVAILCITKASMHFNKPWLLVLYVIVPVLSYPGFFVGRDSIPYDDSDIDLGGDPDGRN